MAGSTLFHLLFSSVFEAAMFCSLLRSSCQLVTKPVLWLSGVVLDVIPILREMVRCAEKNLTNVEQSDTWLLCTRYAWGCPV